MADVGRPTVMTKETIDKLEEGFLMGFTDKEASLYANIDVTTLYNYCNDNPNFSTRKELLKEQPKIMAKQNIIKSIKKGSELDSKWYLERKSKNEFSLKQEIDNSHKFDDGAINELIESITGLKDESN